METKGLGHKHRLSGADAAFLYLERKEIPLHIACVTVFDEAIPFEEFVANIDSKLHLVPRYLQVAVAPPFNIGYPTWEDDPHFDIRRHILPVHLAAPGGEAELEELAGHILSRVMDRSKPLWELHVVDGLEGGRGALIVKIHHALADGVAGAAILNVIFNTTREGSYALRKPRARTSPPPRTEPSLTDAIASAVQSTVENLVAAETGILNLAQALLTDRTQKGLQGLVSLLPELAASVERLPFNRPCSGDRKFCWAEFDFADVQAIRAAQGGTVNDVVLTVLTRALASYVKLHGETVTNRFLRVVCPVSVRRDDERQTLGNCISFMPVALPMDVQDPVKMLQAVAKRTEIMKNTHAADVVAIAASWLGVAPPPLQAGFWWGIPQLALPLPLFNIICTNVPGSPVPLYTVGKRMIASYPQVPTGHELGIGCAVQSYAGKLFLGLNADAHVAADAHRLRDFMLVSFRELCRAVGVKKTKPPVAKARKVKAKPAKPAKHAPVKKPEPVEVEAEAAEPAPTEAPETVSTPVTEQAPDQAMAKASPGR